MKERGPMVIKTESSVARNKAASAICKRLFPSWSKPPTQGELQRMIIQSQEKGGSEKQIKTAGNWWLWARNLMIENIITKKERQIMMDQAVSAATKQQPIHFVSTRSPELLHAQVEGQGDKSLPRSKIAIKKLVELSSSSSEFLPTQTTIILADRAVDNLETIQKACPNLETTILENLERLQEICESLGLNNWQILRMSELDHPQGKLRDILDLAGNSQIPIQLDARANKLIAIATRESQHSHQRMFGWTEKESETHNRKLGITMGLVGQAVQLLTPPPILIHNESFIARGSLNNLFTSSKNPIPVICLKDLLERKKSKR